MKNKLFVSLVVLSSSLASFAQVSEKKIFTTADYERAVKFLGASTNKNVFRSNVNATWLDDGRFWYSVNTANGQEFVLINPSDGSRKTAADKKTLLQGINEKPALARGGNAIFSPDGSKSVFIKDWNLWLRDTKSKKESQLTTDGVKDFGYATDNAGWRKSEKPIVLWSPDSKKIATFQQDQRHVSDMYLVSTNVGAPKLEAWKYPLPEDKDIIRIHRVIIEVDNAKMIRLQLPADPRRGTLCDDIACSGSFDDNWWNAEGTRLAFVSTSRNHQQAKMRIADAVTGQVRDVLEENVKTQYESGQGNVNIGFLDKTNEVIWYSERDNWGHLYLYDARNGKLKNQITKGEFAVTEIVKTDEKSRVIYFLANGREKGRDPYFSHLYRVDFTGKNLQLLTPEDGNHNVTLSPDGKYFVDNFSRPETASTAVLRDLKGKLVANLEKTDISKLSASGWKAPLPVTVRSADKSWDLYGLVFTPTNLDPHKKYPVINYIYPGPQGGGFGSRSFSSARSDHQALAELGFVVVIIDGGCNPGRSKSFHDACYGNMAENTLQDQMAGIRELAAKYPYMDLERIGVWGHSGGGYATAFAMFKYPDFYKVGISESGNHDNRNYEDDWGERYIGLLVKDSKGKSIYDDQASQTHAKNLKGKLLLAHGGMDDNVPPYNTYLVVDALIKANKDFDLVIFPNARHGFGVDTYYMMRRRWDYFVRHLLNAEPPQGFVIKP